jgi:hypothetical protein
MTIKNLNQLELKLSYNGIANNGAFSIAQALLAINNLTQLDLNLESNNIAKEGA